MSTDKKTPTVDLSDYLPPVDADDVAADELDLSFGLDDDGNESDDTSNADEAGDDEGAGKKAEGGEDEGKDEGGDAGDDKDGAGDEKPESGAGKDKAKDNEGKDKKAAKPMVPKSRLDEVLAANRKLKAELQTKNAAVKTEPKDDKDKPKEFDFDSAEDRYQDAVLEGDKEKARAIRAEIRAAEQAQVEERVAAKYGATNQRDRTNEALLKATADIEREFPILNSEADDYNEEIANEMIDLYTGLVASGKDPLDAIAKALEVTVKMHDLVGDEKVVDKTTPAKDLKKKLDASRQQPPAAKRSETPKKQVDPDAIDVTALSDDEWDALPEAVKAKLRGDEV